MRIGLLADIHADTANLRKAIDRLDREEVDQYVVLGDVIYDRRDATETVDLLRGCGAVGVWGNHDIGLAVDPDPELAATYPKTVLEFYRTLQPQIQWGEIILSHIYPFLDASDVMSYYTGRQPEDQQTLDECFSRVPHRVTMVGHFHRWLAATPAGPIDWDADSPLELDSGQRYFLVIHAVMDGWAAVFDDEQHVLKPIHV